VPRTKAAPPLSAGEHLLRPQSTLELFTVDSCCPVEAPQPGGAAHTATEVFICKKQRATGPGQLQAAGARDVTPRSHGTACSFSGLNTVPPLTARRQGKLLVTYVRFAGTTRQHPGHYTELTAGCDALAAVTMNMAVFWAVAPRSVV
jgi:hypothetical protein